ncbi:hypothetical protein ACFS5J_11995 [Flavobacterium chuncheonense]|uniref:Tetratricopeptide repeat protein n=1 Tax=Flavobacterium chuncheonense TaxID=2026653 RepID=A0ABW5YNY8_9FLAO
MKTRILLLVALFLTLFSSCKKEKANKIVVPKVTAKVSCMPITTDKDWYTSGKTAPLFKNLGDFNRTITTSVPLAQQYFNQGMVLAYGFNHAEATRSFYYATQLDPNSPMAFWGYAYVLGPNYNAGMESDNYERAYNAIQKAIALLNENTPIVEKDLIHALATRYVALPVEDRSDLDKKYAIEMGKIFQNYPDDPDIGFLYAESQMNLHPWDLYDKQGNPKEWTPEILRTINHVLKKSPKHCGIHHLNIHAVEASKNPGQGLNSAKLYDEGLVPGAGHLVHMPSHIYIRTGDYHKGTKANLHAIAVDSNYVSNCHAQGVYPLAYFPHNQHFLVATATLEGNSKWALDAANSLSQNTSLQLMKEPGWSTLQHYYAIPFFVYVKFGKWDTILAFKNEVTDLEYPKAIEHYARGMAYVGKGEMSKAKAELASLQELAGHESLKSISIWEINSVYDIVQIAEKILNAEILATEKKYTESIKLLKRAVAIEDALNYNEPPDWFFSVRHHLGAVQLEAKQYKTAIQTYSEDLKKFPKNGWALHGLQTAYTLLHDDVNLQLTNEQLKTAWKTADIELHSSTIK